MTRTTALCAAALAILAMAVPTAQTTQPKPAPMSKLMASVQGAWTMTNSNGQDMAGSGQDIIITITENKYVQTVNGQVAERGTFKIDETKKPLAIDLQILEGDDAGSSQVGIIEIDGKTMYGKIGEPGGTIRPTDFQPAAGFFTFTMVKK